MANMILILTALLIMVIIMMDWNYLGLKECVGGFVLHRLFPCTYPHKGDRVDVFINGVWNRTATVTACCYDYIVILNAVRCPIDYRGRFYAIGEDANGNILVYVDKRHKHLVKRAEIIRKICGVPDDFATFLDVDEGRDTKEIFSGIKETDDEVPEIDVEGMQ